MDARTEEKQLSGLMLPSENGEETKSGLVLDTQSDKDRLEELKEAGQKAETVKQFAAAAQPTANTSVPQSSVSSNNANPLLQSKIQSALQEVEKQNWIPAGQMYNDILDSEPENAEANLGLFMVYLRIPGKKYIPEAARDAMKNNADIFLNKQYMRARRYADDNMKKELESYERGRDYLIAIEELQRAKTFRDYQKVSEMFDRLGDFADARKQKEECDGYWQKPLYDSALQKIKSAKSFYEFMMIAEDFDKLGDYEDAREQRKLAAYLGAICMLQDAEESKSESDFSTAIRIFKELGDYSDSKEKIKECEEGIEQLKGQSEIYEKYKQEYEDFEKQVTALPAIKQHEAKIASKRASIDSLKNKRAARRFDIQKRWIVIMAIFGILCYLLPALFQWLINCSPEYEAIYYHIAEVGLIAGTLEFIKALLNMIVLLLAGFVAFIVFCIVAAVVDEWIGFMSALGTMAGLVFGIPILTAVDIYVNTNGYRERVHLIGTVALAIAIALIAARAAGKAWNDPKARLAKLKQLEQSVNDEYEQIEKCIGMEYQKIYDKYPIVGSKRKEVSAVQKQLMVKFKKK